MKHITFMILVVGLLLAGCALDNTVIEPDVPGQEPDANASMETTEEDNEEQEPEEGTTDSDEEVPEFDGVALSFIEGDLIKLSPEAIDPDGDKVTYVFGEPLSSDGKWQTEIGDEGNYLVSIIASDGKLDTETNVLLIIERANRPPVIDCDEEAVLREGERFYVGNYCEIFDEDEEEVVVYYSGWPGVSRYVTTFDDAGEHTLLITANDKLNIVKHELPIVVINVNRAPAFPDGFPEKITGMEGDILTIDTPSVTDEDGDKISFQFSEPFDSKGVWKTKIGDAGTYDVDVVASDGETTTKHTIVVEIQLANTKPVMKEIPDVSVDEGETIRLPISATDREGDELTVVISGWMSTPEYTTTYDDAGEYTVKVVASDGVHEASQIVHITVNNVNRPPQFVSVD